MNVLMNAVYTDATMVDGDILGNLSFFKQSLNFIKYIYNGLLWT